MTDTDVDQRTTRAGGPAPVRAARRAEQLTALLQRITALANEATDTASALHQTVTDVCETMAWPAGQALVLDGSGELVPAAPPHVIDETGPEMSELLASASDGSGHPLARQVLDSGTPAWVRDIEREDGIPAGSDWARGWLAFPVVVDDDVSAVLQFVSVEQADPEDDFLQTMANVGRQLGVLIERNRARGQLEAVNTDLERSNRELERFAYVASHDLQEPLRKIVGFTQLLEQRYGDQLDGEAGEFMDIVVDGALRMRQLINDLLTYSRAGRRQPPMGRVELEDVLDAALDDLHVAIEESDASVTVDGPLPTAHGNDNELRELLVNLIGNALKYRGDATPEIGVSAAPHGDGWWRLTVADNGIGIDPEHHDRIFEVFQRLHGAGQYSGTGIGLAVCRQIADHHGGRIWVESTSGEGSRFHVTLPPAVHNDEGTTDE